MFGDFTKFRCVVVTGPQRSGTTICSRMIAEDTGFRYVDEDDYGTKDRDAWAMIVEGSRGGGGA